MVTTLTRMIPDLDKSLDIVSRELVGSCRLSPSTHAPPALAAGQAVVVPITPASTVSDITPGVSGHWPGRRELHGPVGRRRDRAALERRGRHARIMALPKPKTPDDEIAELKQRIAALEASKPPNPKEAGRLLLRPQWTSVAAAPTEAPAAPGAGLLGRYLPPPGGVNLIWKERWCGPGRGESQSQ